MAPTLWSLGFSDVLPLSIRIYACYQQCHQAEEANLQSAWYLFSKGRVNVAHMTNSSPYFVSQGARNCA